MVFHRRGDGQVGPVSLGREDLGASPVVTTSITSSAVDRSRARTAATRLELGSDGV
jgi:hypothetical protein